MYRRDSSAAAIDKWAHGIPPRAPMRIHYSLLSAPDDISKLRHGFRVAREIASQPALDPYRGVELLPGPNVKTDGEIDAYISSTRRPGKIGKSC